MPPEPVGAAHLPCTHPQCTSCTSSSPSGPLLSCSVQPKGSGANSGSSMAALELVAMDMKAQGMFVCRTLSFAGGWVQLGSNDGGYGALEMDMKAQGMFVCRALSFAGGLMRCGWQGVPVGWPKSDQHVWGAHLGH